MLLTGTYRRTLDEKLRFAVPKTLRTGLGDGDTITLYVAPGTDGCLALYAESAFQELGSKLSEGSPNGPEVRAFSRLFYSRAQAVEVDGQGRMRIPSELRDVAGLQTEVVVVGVRDHLELWDAARWDAYLLGKQGQYDEFAERAFE
ncbi:MAG TPA: division/cell wall cluster transcriptional repressor MraZ [Pirellulaceae bacterium]